MLILLLTACLFGSPSHDDDDDDDDAEDDDTPADTDEDEGPTGSVVRFKTTEVAIEAGEPVAVDVPRGGTFVRVDSCYDDGDVGVVCDIWAGGYQLYEDGTLTLTPGSWDGSLAKVTWLVIE